MHNNSFKKVLLFRSPLPLRVFNDPTAHDGYGFVFDPQVIAILLPIASFLSKKCMYFYHRKKQESPWILLIAWKALLEKLTMDTGTQCYKLFNLLNYQTRNLLTCMNRYIWLLYDIFLNGKPFSKVQWKGVIILMTTCTDIVHYYLYLFLL